LCLIGIHPHEAKSWEDSYYDELRDIAKNPECVAIGICGLDYNKDFSSPDIQRKVFELQVLLKYKSIKYLFILNFLTNVYYMIIICKQQATG